MSSAEKQRVWLRIDELKISAQGEYFSFMMICPVNKNG
jgi:hypothetical protein